MTMHRRPVRGPGGIAVYTIFYVLAAGDAYPQQSTPVALTVTSTADYIARVAPDSLASAFGVNLAQRTEVAQLSSSGALPTSLAGVAVEVNGRRAGLFFVSRSQINIHVPVATEVGVAEVSVVTGNTVVARGQVEVQAAAPGLLSSDGSGRGVGAILNAVTYQRGPFDVETDANPGTDKRTRLALFATGIRSAPAHLSRYEAGANVAAYVKVSARSTDGRMWDLPVEYAGAAPIYHGLDQVNIVLPPELDGIGELDLFTSIGETVSNTVRITVRNSLPPEIMTISPETLVPGGRVAITGRRFAASRTGPQTRSKLIFALPSGQEIAFAPDEVTNESMRAYAFPFSLDGQAAWYTGPVRVCVEADGRRGCSTQPVSIGAAAAPAANLGSGLTNTVRTIQAQTVELVRLQSSPALADAVQALNDGQFRELQGIVADAVAGRPRVITLDFPDGPHTVQLDTDFLSKVEAMLANTRAEQNEALDEFATSTAKLRARLAATACPIDPEERRIVARTIYESTRKLDRALENALLGTASAGLGVCIGSGGTLCAPALKAVLAAEAVALKLNIGTFIVRIGLDLQPNRLDALILDTNSVRVNVGQTSADLNVQGVFKSLATKGLAAEAVEEVGTKVLQETLKRILPSLPGVGFITDELERTLIAQLAGLLYKSLGAATLNNFVSMFGSALPAPSETLPIGFRSLAAIPAVSSSAEIKLACQDASGPSTVIRGLSVGGPQIIDLFARDTVLWTGEAPPQRAVVVRVSDPQTSLAELRISATRFVVGQTGTVSIALANAAPSSGATIRLNCDAAFSTLPCSVTIPPGQVNASIPVTMLAASVTTLGNQIAAQYQGRQLAVSFFVDPAPNTLAGVDVIASPAAPGASTSGTVRLSAPAPVTGVDVALRSSVSTVQVPATVRVRAGFTTAAFQIATADGAAGTTATITATLGPTSRSTTLAVSSAGVRGIDVVSITTDKASYMLGQSVTVTYVLRNSTSADSGGFRNGISGWHVPGYTGFITFRNTASLPPGGQVSDSITLTLPQQGPSGTYKVRIEADYYWNVARERDNPNSVREVAFTVTAP